MDAETSPTKRVIVEDAEGLPTEKKTEIEEKVADALEENFDKHEMIAKAHNADNTEETEEDTTEDKMETKQMTGAMIPRLLAINVTKEKAAFKTIDNS